MKIIMTGGGTGGHIYPAIAIADKIKEHHPDAEILFVGTTHGLEKKIVPAAGYPIEFVTVEGLSRKNMLKNVRVAVKLVKGNLQASKLVKRFAPDVVIGTGGYASAPVIREGARYGAKVYIQEQNAFPGVTNKLNEKHADKVFLGFAAGAKYFKHPEKHVVSGNPVRDAFFKTDKSSARAALGFKDDDFVVLSFGGSQGAGRINKAMMEVVTEFTGEEKFKIVMGAGAAYYDAILGELDEKNVEIKNNIQIMEYINNMEQYLSAADMVICRSGALTVAEVTVCGTPAIFIPSPIVTGNHQYHNAKAVTDEGGGVLLPEDELSGERLIKEIRKFEADREALAEMSRKCRACAYDKSADIIYENLDLPEK